MHTTARYLRAAVTVAVLAGILLWMGAWERGLFLRDDGLIRAGLSLVAFLAVLWRPTPDPAASPRHVLALPALLGLAASGLLLCGIGFLLGVHQFQWVGLLALAGAGLYWSLPRGCRANVPAALFVLYWAHPLPGQTFQGLQLAMQQWSVAISQWLLHALNVRVWADGMVLRTASAAFEVPAACSGLRAATTLALFALGLGLFYRMRAGHLAVFVLAALAQALALNVVRIAGTIVLNPWLGDRVGFNRLHDATGVLLLAGCVLLVCERTAWHRLSERAQIVRDDYSAHWRLHLSGHPPFWVHLWYHRGLIALGLALATALTAAGVRVRPAHRLAMWRDVAEALQKNNDLDPAVRLARRVAAKQPGDMEWRLTCGRMLLLAGRHAELLALSREIRPETPRQEMERSVLRAYAFMSLGRADDAAFETDRLPETVRLHDPRVAMIMAELAAYADQPDAVATYLPRAVPWPHNTRRIQALFPYLRGHQRWETIRTSDRGTPFTDLPPLCAAAEAYMNLGESARVAELTLAATERWPTDSRVIELLSYMVRLRPDSEWSTRLTDHVLRTVPGLDDSDYLYGLIRRSFEMLAPDLAWCAWQRLLALDPQHPLLHAALALYGNGWFLFRNRRVGIPGRAVVDATDLRAVYLCAWQLAPFRAACRMVPGGPPLAAGDSAQLRDESLARALAEFEVRHAAGQLTPAMSHVFAQCLERAGRAERAREVLAAAPRIQGRSDLYNREQIADLYARGGNPQGVYETLRPLLSSPALSLRALQSVWRAMRALNLPVAAEYTARLATARHPHSPQAAYMLASSLVGRDAPEEALLATERDPLRPARMIDQLRAQLLYQTQRHREADALCRTASLSPLQPPPGTPQRLTPPPAEFVLAPFRWTLPSHALLDQAAGRMRQNRVQQESPFLYALSDRWLTAHEQLRHGIPTNAPAPEFMTRPFWTRIGRDPVERAMALHQLAVLLCYAERWTEAFEATLTACGELPAHAPFWHMAVALAPMVRRDPAPVVEQAITACPDDPGLQLARLVLNTQAGTWDEPRVIHWLADCTGGGVRLPPETMVRIGDYLWRGGMLQAAAIAARDAATRAPGLLPAHTLALNVALGLRDRAWAIESTHRATAAALSPPAGFYVKLLELKLADGGDLDIADDTVDSLKSLRAADPGNPDWAAMLSYVRLHRGGTDVIDALYQALAAIQAGATNLPVYLLAAEASRLAGNNERAIELLRESEQRFPGQPAVLNNLLYTLAQQTGTVAEAQARLPELIAAAGSEAFVRDTVGVVLLRSGQLEAAAQAFEAILRTAAPGSRHAFRARLYLAEIDLTLANASRAMERVTLAFKSAGQVPYDDILAANDLLVRIERATAPSTARPAATNTPTVH